MSIVWQAGKERTAASFSTHSRLLSLALVHRGARQHAHTHTQAHNALTRTDRVALLTPLAAEEGDREEQKGPTQWRKSLSPTLLH